MSRYFLEIAYDGSAYHGWQVQLNALTVQEVVDNRLSTLLQETVTSVGCGRTDTGVHAEQFYLHFDLQEPLPQDRDLVHQLNRVLPDDIVALRLLPVATDAHARFDAVERVYQYRIIHRKDPFKRFRYTYLPYFPDYSLMNRVAGSLIGKHDFSCFSKAHTQTLTNDCTVNRAVWKEEPGGTYCFEISADRFLRNMVRAVVGTLLEVGQGRMNEPEFQALLQDGNRQDAGKSMPAHGLSLVLVRYPYVQDGRKDG